MTTTEQAQATGATTLPPLLDGLAACCPDAPALHWASGTLTYSELARASRRVAAGLARAGVGPGDRVAAWLPNSPEWLIAHFACARLGVALISVNTRFRSSEVGDLLGRSRARVLLLAPDFKGIDFRGILADVDREALDRLETIVICGTAPEPAAPMLGRQTLRFEDVAGHGPLPRDLAHPDAECIVFTTSGTTSAPKLVAHRQRSVAHHAREVAAVFGYDDADAAVLQGIPLCGTFGHVQAMATVLAGRPLVLMAHWDPEDAAALMVRHRVTHMNGADTMFEGLFEAAPPEAVARLRGCGFAAFGGGDPEAFAAEGDRRGMSLIGLYGMSEVQALFARQSTRATAAARATGGGRLVSPEAAFRICDPQTDRELPRGESGELQLVGPSRFAEYLDQADATRRAHTADGWFRTGDLAVAVTDRCFTYLSRMDDSLRLGGFLVNPAEIERHAERFPGVDACQTIGVPGPRGLRPVAFVLMAPGARLDEDAVRAHCRAGLAGYKVPERVFSLDAFPTTPSANGEKIQRVRLREMAIERLA